MKTTTMTKKATEETKTVGTVSTVTNPFEFVETAVEDKKSRRLDYTPALQEKARGRAVELIKTVGSTRMDLTDQANAMMDSGDAGALIQLIEAVYPHEVWTEDAAEVLEGCPDEELSKMLESQRSNRSKAKKAGLRTKLVNTVAYISAMYAELLIRERTGKAYVSTGRGSSGEELDLEKLAADPDALKRKINSLASKKSRLSKVAPYDEEASKALEQTEKDLAELRALRPTPSRTVVKSIPIEELRKALGMLNPDEVPAEILELMKKIG